jgi:hypothetical protein
MSDVRRARLASLTCFNHTCGTLTRFRLWQCSIGAVAAGGPARAQYYYPTPREYDGLRDCDGPRDYDGPRDFDGLRQTWNGCPRAGRFKGEAAHPTKVPLVEDGTHRTAARLVRGYRASTICRVSSLVSSLAADRRPGSSSK